MNRNTIPLARLGMSAIAALFAAGITLFSATASAYSTFGSGSGSKWDDPTWGTGATIYWSFMTAGVGLGTSAPSGWSGTNSLGSGAANDIRVIIDGNYGVGSFDAALQRAFDTWSAAADLTFVQVADLGGDFGTDTTPDIRVGAFSFGVGDFAGAAGFGPPGDDLNFPDALAGDLVFNDLNNFAIDPGNEGDALLTGPGNLYLNDLEGLFLHEIGHTLGLGHSDVINGVMCGYVFPGNVFDGSACDYSHVNRLLSQDDINGIQVIYGPAAVPVPAAAWLFMSGMVALVGVGRNRKQKL